MICVILLLGVCHWHYDLGGTLVETTKYIMKLGAHYRERRERTNK